MSIAKGMLGTVISVDKDGDALIKFPALEGVICQNRWVLRLNFRHMRVCATAHRTRGKKEDMPTC